MCFSVSSRAWGWVPIQQFIVWLLICSWVAGCATRLSFDTQPAWHVRTSGAHLISSGAVFYGIGVAEGSGPPTLMRATADNRARQEMARVLDRYIALLMEESARAARRPREEREQIAGRLLQNSLQRAVISDHWSDGAGQQRFALSELPLETFKQVIMQDGGLAPAFRAELVSSADAVHAKLRQ